MVQDEDVGKKVNQFLNWFLWLIIFIVEVHSYTRKTLHFIIYAQFFLLIRNILPMLDLDQKS